MVNLCDIITIFRMGVTKILSGWLNWEEGFFIRFNDRYILLTLFVKMYVSVVSVLVCLTVRSSSYNLGLRMFG